MPMVAVEYDLAVVLSLVTACCESPYDGLACKLKTLKSLSHDGNLCVVCQSAVVLV